ncbi:MAG: SLBB domain-containing protein [Fimbriimonadales bacterium]
MRQWLLSWLLVVVAGLPLWANDELEYVLDTGDVLSVVVLRHEQFSGEYTVPPNGRVVFHGVGELPVRGLTLAQLTEQLRTRLQERLRNPEVTVSLKTARPPLAFVEGQVNKPGAYPVQPGWRVFELIASAEGLKVPPERAQALLIRGEAIIPLDLSALYHKGEPSANLPIRPGDKITVQLKPTLQVTVTGEVKKPGIYSVDEGAGVLQALAQAEGVTDFAKLRDAVIDRSGSYLRVDLYEAMVLAKPEANRPLQDGDVVVVPRNLSRFAIVGQVNQAGYYTLPEGQPLLLSDAIGMAKGVTTRAQTSSVYILRMRGEQIERIRVPYLQFLRRGDPKGNPPILEGDVVFVPEANRVDLNQILSAVTILSIADRLGWVN